MENRLKGIKKVLNQKTFSQLTFTEKHRQNIQKEIREQGDTEAIILSILQLLTQERTGYELSHLLRGRGVRRFEDIEGSLYILLHSLENKEVLRSTWIPKEEVKYYQLTNKGKKLLKQTEKKQNSLQVLLQQLLEGGTDWRIAGSHS